jgi:hypothetical protein
VPDEGHVHEPVPVAAAIGAAPAISTPIALPGPGRGVTASHVLGLSRTIGNAAVARALASGALIAREPAPAGAPAPAAAPGGGVPTAPVAGAPELSQAPFATLLGTVEGWSPREDVLQAHLATPGVDGKRLNLADTIVMRKETGVDEAGVVEIAQELYIVGTPVGDRDAVFTYLGFGGLALPSNIEAFAGASASAAAAIATMSTFEERAGAVLGPINARLSSVGVPTISRISKEGGGNAHFNKKSWTISVDPDFAMRGGPAAPGELLAAVYHEARHAEQDFLVARHMARGKSAAEIAAEHDVPIEVATAAKASPLPVDDPQAALAERLRGPVADDGPDPDLAKIRDRLIEKKNKGEPFTAEEQAVIDKAYARYKNRPHEADAFLVEALAKQGQALR